MVMMPKPLHCASKGIAHGGCVKPPVWPPIKPPAPEPIKPTIDPHHFVDRFNFSRTDADKDGVISKNEMTKGATSLKDYFQRAQRFEKFDTDRDGNVDQKEYLAGVAKERKLADLFEGWNPLKRFGK